MTTYQKLLKLETTSKAADKRRLMGDERLALHVALESKDRARIKAQETEAERVIALWESIA